MKIGKEQVGSARIDENGRGRGGRAGDQKQTTTPDYKGEVSQQDIYVHSKGFIVARLKKPAWAKKCAKAMITACDNPHIGYDQDQRYGLVNRDVDTTEDCETDCSALVRRCILDATGKDVGDIRTITMRVLLAKSGLFLPFFQYKKNMPIYTGDILFTGILTDTPISGHTVACTKGWSPVDHEVPYPYLKKGYNCPDTGRLQALLKAQGFTDSKGNPLDIDQEFGKNTDYALRAWQKANGLISDGEYCSKSYAKMQEIVSGV